MILYNNTKHFTAPEVSRVLATNAYTVRRWIREGLVESISIGKKHYISETEIDRLFTATRKDV